MQRLTGYQYGSRWTSESGIMGKKLTVEMTIDSIRCYQEHAPSQATRSKVQIASWKNTISEGELCSEDTQDNTFDFPLGRPREYGQAH